MRKKAVAVLIVAALATVGCSSTKKEPPKPATPTPTAIVSLEKNRAATTEVVNAARKLKYMSAETFLRLSTMRDVAIVLTKTTERLLILGDDMAETYRTVAAAINKRYRDALIEWAAKKNWPKVLDGGSPPTAEQRP